MSGEQKSISKQYDVDKKLESKQQFADKMVKIAIAGGSSSKSWFVMDYHVLVPLLITLQMLLRRLLMSLLRLANTRSCCCPEKYAKICASVVRTAYFNINTGGFY